MADVKERPPVPKFGDFAGPRNYFTYHHDNSTIVLSDQYVRPYVEEDDEILQGHVCKVNGCSEPTMASGRTDLCHDHYDQWRVSGHRKKKDKAGFLLSFTTGKPLQSKQVVN